jgi:hypothetical protein
VHGVLGEPGDERRLVQETRLGRCRARNTRTAEAASAQKEYIHGDEVVGEDGGRGGCAGEQEQRMERAAAAEVAGAAA